MRKRDEGLHATEVIISVSGGVVNAVCTDRPNLKVYLVDFDELKEDPTVNYSLPYPVDCLGAFHAATKPYVSRYRGLKKLVRRIAVSR